MFGITATAFLSITAGTAASPRTFQMALVYNITLINLGSEFPETEKEQIHSIRGLLGCDAV
jgi:hypothetical protein